MNVLVVFSSHTGAMESIALRVAVTAVQGRANIRLRRVVVAAPEDPTPEARRMAREYVEPKPADVEWADSLYLGGRSAQQLQPFLELLADLHAQGKLTGKKAASEGDGLEAALLELGMSIVPAQDLAATDRS